MAQNKRCLIGYKVFFALLGFSAIITEMATLVERGTLNALNFFSFFTIQSNTLVVIMLLLSALALAADKSQKLDNFRSAVTLYILIVGIGFSLLLAGLENSALTAVPWDNTVLHYIIPLAVLLDFLIDRPKRVFRFRNGIVWLLFPLAYVVYSLVRGPIVDWYPYPFLNPANSGYDAVAVTAIGLLILSLILTAGIIRLSGRRKAA